MDTPNAALRLLLEARSLSQRGRFVLPVDSLKATLDELAPVLQARSTDTEHRYPHVKLWWNTKLAKLAINPVFRFYYQPLDTEHGCTCPDGQVWHTMSQKMGYGPRPVQPVAAGRTFQRDFDCRWCIHLAAYWPKWYDWLWRHVATASITILGHAPPANEIDFRRDRRSINYTIETLHENISTPSKEVVQEIMTGRTVEVGLAQGVLHELRATRQYIKMEMMDYYAYNSEPAHHIKQQDKGLRAIIAAVECASFDPRWLTTRGCVRLPIIPDWCRVQQEWRVKGHFIVTQQDYPQWLLWMAPQGVTELTLDL